MSLPRLRDPACDAAPADTRLRRLRLLDAALRRERSATALLERWCGRSANGARRRLVVERLEGGPATADRSRRRRLRLAPGCGLRYRRVRLLLGDAVLSEAENWYVPCRLTPSMNRRLERTTIPFGRVVRALGVRRRTLSRHLLPEGDVPPAGSPPIVLRHQALLLRRDGLPFSEVIERYTAAVLEPAGRPG